jgi:uncharacterized DUF497 family protein
MIRADIEAKINEKHQVTGDEVRETFVMQPDVSGNWEEHGHYGRRYVAIGLTYTGRPMIAWFYPVDESDGVWSLGTARYVDGGKG